MDGDGSFQFQKCSGLPFLELSNTDDRMVNRCREIAGGQIYRYDKKKGFARPVWKWTLFGLPSVPLARALIPYLAVKARRAAILAALPTESYKGRGPVPKLVQYLREEAARMLKPLNHRGSGELS
jgi:hypothetical protein